VSRVGLLVVIAMQLAAMPSARVFETLQSRSLGICSEPCYE
jgi:hypothetical protein